MITSIVSLLMQFLKLAYFFGGEEKGAADPPTPSISKLENFLTYKAKILVEMN